MKILQVSLGLGASSGGPVRSITGLTRALSELDGCSVAYFVHNPKGVERFNLGNTTVFRGRWDDCGNDYSGDFENVLDSVKPDIVHFHGIWHWTLHRDQKACRKRNIPYVIAPRGSLDAWSLSQKRFKKKIAMWLFQFRDLKKAAALHVTAEMEKAHCVAAGYNGRFILASNGVNLPEILPPHESSAGIRLLFVGRMHPKKGLIELIDALASVSNSGLLKNKQWCCEFVYTVNGDEEHAYEAEVKSKAEILGLSAKIIFTGALDDNEKWKAYRTADLFVLPTYTENFGIVVAEALYAGLPVITTVNAPWKDLQEKNAGWWIALNKECLVNTLIEAMNLSVEERLMMGVNGHDLILSKYSWPAIAKETYRGYIDVLGGLK